MVGILFFPLQLGHYAHVRERHGHSIVFPPVAIAEADRLPVREEVATLDKDDDRAHSAYTLASPMHSRCLCLVQHEDTQLLDCLATFPALFHSIGAGAVQLAAHHSAESATIGGSRALKTGRLALLEVLVGIIPWA